MKPENIVKAYDARLKERAGIEEVWDLIERFVLPFGGVFNNGDSANPTIDWKKREIFDSTGINANQLLASNIQSSLTNPVTTWANYAFGNEVLQDNQEAAEWRQECEHAVMTSIRTSNFNNEAGEFYLDLTSFALGIQSQEVIEENGDLQSIPFDTIPPNECVFDLDLQGYPRNFYRKLAWTSIQLADKFGKETLPDKLRRELESPTKTTNKHKIIFCIWKRETNGSSVDTYSILPVDKRPYGAKYILYDTKEQLGEETGYYEMPVHMARWRTISGSNWGFCPAMIAIWDILSLNQMTELILKAGEKVLDPAILTTNRGVFGDIDLGAAGVTVVTDMNAIQPFESKARFDVSQMNKVELQQSIRDMFYYDQLQLKDSPAMTAYEVQARIQLMQRLIGPTYGRLQSHYLDPMLERHFKILYRYKKLPPMPDIVRELGGELVVNYTGPLASAQRMDEVQIIESTLQNIAGLSEAFPSARDLVDVDTSVRELLEAKGAPAKMLLPQDKVDANRKAAQEQEQEMMKLQQAQMQGDAMQSMGKGQKDIQDAE